MTHHQRAQSVLFAHTLTIKGKRLSHLFALLLLTAGLFAGIARPVAAESSPVSFVDSGQSARLNTPDANSKTGDRPNQHSSANTHTGETGSQNKPGGSGIDGASYTGVNYDWSVTWDDVVWNAPADQEDNSGGIDYFQLASTREEGAPPMMVGFETTEIYEGDLDACADGGAYWVAQDAPGSNTNIAEADVRLPIVPDDSSVVAFTYTYQPGEDSPVELIGVQVCLPLTADGAILQVRLVTPAGIYSQARGYFEELIAAIELN